MLILAVTGLLPTACKDDVYETGDGNLSYMKAEMCNITAQGGLVTNIVTDEDISLPFTKGLSITNTINDTVIRCMMYYKYLPIETTSVISTINVTIIEADDTANFDKTRTISRWESKNKKYINFYISEPQGTDSLYTEKKYYSVVKK